MRRSATREFLGLFVVLALAATVGLWWTYRVPFYQHADELAHADYVFFLYDAGTSFVVHDGKPSNEVAPATRYLINAVGYRHMRYNPYGRAPTGYGSIAYFRATDARAPGPTGTVPHAGDPVPYMMLIYPYPYYATSLAVLTVTERLGHSLTLGFFAMRALGIVAMCATLALGYLTLRRYGIETRTALAAILGLGLFPLMTATSSSVQPDTFVTTFVALVLFGGSLLVRRGDARVAYAIVCIGLAGLAATKQHYFAAAWAGTLPFVIAKTRARDRSYAVATFALPIVAFAITYTSLGPVHGVESVAHFAARTHAATASDAKTDSLLLVATKTIASAIDGNVALSYWSRFGYRGGRIFPGSIVDFAVGVFNVASFTTFVLAQRRLLWRIVAVARRRSIRTALALVSSSHAFNVYLAVTLVLFAATIASRGALELQGRYWLPVSLALAIFTLQTLPRTLRTRASRMRAQGILALSMGAFGAIACASAAIAMNDNYYGSPVRLEHEPVAEVQSARTVVLPEPQSVTIAGVAVDAYTGLPAATMFATVDRNPRPVIASTGIASPALARIFNDPRIAKSGFVARVPAADLSPGKHVVTLFVGDPARPAAALSLRDRVTISVGLPIR